MLHRLLKLLADFVPAFTAEEILDAINTMEQTKGLIVNQIPVYRTTQNFLDNIFEKDYDLVKELDLRKHLANFVLPLYAVQELEEMVELAQQNTDALSLENFAYYMERTVRPKTSVSFLRDTTIEVEKGYVVTIDGKNYLRID